MPRPFVVVGESAAGVADRGHSFPKIDEAYRGDFFIAGLDIPLSKDRIERILSKHVLDIGDEQFLVLLLMMHAQDEDWLDFAEQLFVSIGKQIVDMRVNPGAIALCLSYSRPRN